MGDAIEWMTVKEAAEWSGYHPHHLRELVRDGKIEAIKKGLTWWVKKQSVEAYLQEGRELSDGRRGPK